MISRPPTNSASLQAQEAIQAKCFHPSGSFVEFNESEVDQSILARFDKIVAQYPDRIALKTENRILSYAELNAAANRVAHVILQQKVEVSEPVALLFGNGIPFVIASMGVLKAGRTQVALESNFPCARLRYVIEHSQSSIVLTDTVNLPLARELGEFSVVNLDTLQASTVNPDVKVDPDAAATIDYTSGSTGQPKGVVWTHRGILHVVMRCTNVSHMCMHDRLVMFRASVRAYLYALLNGAAYYPVDLRRQEPTRLAEWLRKEEVTVYRSAVSAFRSFAAVLDDTEQFSKLRLILLFGEPVYPTDIGLYRKLFSDGCVLAASLGCNELDDYAYYFFDQDSPPVSTTLPGGYPLADMEILLLDEDGCPVAVDHVGEIAVRSRYTAAGYWRRPDLNCTAFVPDPAGTAALLYRTGDIGRIDAAACLFHLGRRDFQVKIRGFRVEVTEVETALLDIPGVTEAVVVGREEGPGDIRLIAYIVPAAFPPPKIADLRSVLAEKLPDYMMPFTFILLETLPLTATGKVDRRALPDPNHTRPPLDYSFVPPRTALEKKLAGIWADVLRLDRVGVHDKFLDLGGDSLLATQVISRVIAQFEARLPLRALLEAPTVEAMARVIVDSSAGSLEEGEVHAMLVGLESLSNEEAQALLNSESTESPLPGSYRGGRDKRVKPL